MGTAGNVRWADLQPAELEARLAALPVVYLPMGLCEPHGHVAAFGLDTHKADHICDEAARRFGGVVAPTQGYHVHETGYHRPFLDEVVGSVNPRLAGLPPDVVLRTLLFQLRAFVNAGFRTIVVVSGHNGCQADLRLVAERFCERAPVDVVVHSDPELVAGRFPGDHAGRFEISQLLHCRPDLVDLDRAGRVATDPLGRFAQGSDAAEATSDYGKLVVEAMIERVGVILTDLDPRRPRPDIGFIELADVEPVWDTVLAQRTGWVSLGAVPG